MAPGIRITAGEAGQRGICKIELTDCSRNECYSFRSRANYCSQWRAGGPGILKEALVTFPDPDTGLVKALFTERKVRTTPFQISDKDLDLYDQLTQYVEDQSIKAAREDSTRARAVGFTMAMLQRRFASSIYAVRRTLERMKEKREKILEDPAKFRQEQINRRLPEDFDDLPDDEQQEILGELESTVVSYDPNDLRAEITELDKLIREAKILERAEAEVKIRRL